MLLPNPPCWWPWVTGEWAETGGVLHMLYLPVKGSEQCIASVRKGRVEMPFTLTTPPWAPCSTALHSEPGAGPASPHPALGSWETLLLSSVLSPQHTHCCSCPVLAPWGASSPGITLPSSLAVAYRWERMLLLFVPFIPTVGTLQHCMLPSDSVVKSQLLMQEIQIVFFFSFGVFFFKINLV